MYNGSKIILGTVQFGLDYGINNATGKPSPEQVFKMLEYAASQGVDTLDTADAYGNAVKVLGEFNKTHENLFAINTKFRSNQKPLIEQLVNSLRTLQMNTVGTYFYHNYTDFIEYPKILHELVLLKRNNLVKKIGVSIYGNDEFLRCINTPEIDVIQFPFNLLDNCYQRGELMKLAKHKGKELQVRSVFLQGVFFKSLENIPEKIFPLKPYLQKITDIALDNNISLERLALLYPLQQQEIDRIIIGVDNIEQLQKNLIISQENLAPAVAARINEIAVQETELLYPKNWY